MKRLAFLLLSIVFFIQGCGPESDNPDKKIPVGRDHLRVMSNGYKVWKMNPTEAYISDANDGLFVGPNVFKYGYQNSIIYGEVRQVNPPGRDSDVVGFFIYDAETGSTEKGLLKSEWYQQLRKHGIAEGSVHLFSP